MSREDAWTFSRLKPLLRVGVWDNEPVMHDNLYAFLREGFADRLETPFLVRPDAPVVSYREMDEQSARCAALLRKSGIGPGDRVVVQVGKSPDAIALYLGCLRAGAIYVPLNTAYTTHELDYFLADAGPRLMVWRGDAGGEVPGLAAARSVPETLRLDDDGTGSFTDALAGCAPDEDLTRLGADDVVAMLYTSGTTGRSKGALLTLRNLASNAASLVRTWGWRDDDVLLHALPVFHVHGLFVALHCAMLGGSPVLFHARFDAPAVRRALRQATVMMGVPTFYTRLLADPAFGAADCRNMRLFISGSAPLLPASFAEFEARTGHRILERYGMTEAGMITSNPLDGERLPGTVGYPLPDVELRVADGQGRSLPAGQVGDVEIRGPNVFTGYWQRPEKTAAEFRDDGFFVTGDLGSLAPDGRLSLVGRARDLIISGGYNVYPKEIESCLDALDEVAESAVIGVPHADLGEGVIAVVVPAGVDGVDEAAVLARLADRLAGFKRPRRVIAVAELPRNAMGKVQKQDLRKRFADALR